MPAHTEIRIRELCAQAIEAKSDGEIDRIIPELRDALQEHIALAKASLKAQATTIPIIDGLMQKRFSQA